MRQLIALLTIGLVASILVACGGQERQEPGVQVDRVASATVQPTETVVAQPEVVTTSTAPSQTPEATVTPLCAASLAYDPDNHWQIVCSVALVQGESKELFVVVIYDVETKGEALAARTAFEAWARRTYELRDFCNFALYYVYPEPILGEMTPEEMVPTGKAECKPAVETSVGLGEIPKGTTSRPDPFFKQSSKIASTCLAKIGLLYLN
jgi:hypothetical protein